MAAVGAAVFAAAAVAFVDTPQQGSTAVGAHEFRVMDTTTSCSRCHGGTFPHFQHRDQVCTDCHGGGHVATVATCLDCHGGHDDPVPLALCTACHEDNGGFLVTEPIDHATKVDASVCSLCHGSSVAPLSATTTTVAPLAPSSTTTTAAPPASTTTTVAPPPPATTTTTTLAPPPAGTTTTTAVPPSTTTTVAPTTTTTAPPPSSTTTTAPPPNQPPVADAGADRTIAVDELSVFDGRASTDPDGTIVSYSWDFGDGTTAPFAVLAHSYPAAGVYTVTLTVTDDGGLTDTATITVTVE